MESYPICLNCLFEKYKPKKIRFHNIRHSCASVPLAQGVPMKQIQEWLGHSDMSTTANIYSHLDAVSKSETGAAMSKALG
ncbi:MAG: tyrosine-type recombinase/integrase [Clostridia bacterium]|nr:tyrosine-type recombinase/integrase [Clostridia bacterium]